MKILLILMIIWCAVLLWCSLRETKRSLSFVLTVICVSGGIIFLAWQALADEFFSFRFWKFKWRSYQEHFRTLSGIIIFLTIVYGARVLGSRIDKGEKNENE